MKKSLSVLLASAMVSSMFSSIAFAADLDTQAKLDALIQAGIFDKDGTGNGHELDAKMTREQLAKILAKLKGLNEIPGATPYSDVAADRWSAGFINAVSKANPVLMDGVAEGVFNPAGNVTLEQLATVAVRALNLQIDSSATVSGKVSDWAKGYVATAIKAGLISEKSDFTADALRSDLVETTYGAKEALDEQSKPAKVSIKEAKAVGVKTVQVTLDRDVDTSKATLTLKRGSTSFATTTKWSDDKKTATLTLNESSIREGEYTVVLGGLSAEEIQTAEAKFTAQDEKVEKIEFVSPSDTIAYSSSTVVKIKATNQYGEIASASAGNFNYFGTGVTKLTKDPDGYLLATVDTTSQTQGVGIVTITIMNNDSHVSATKTFKVGTVPILSKMELGDPQYSNGTAITGNGDNVKFTLNLYDQYGGVMGYDQLKIGTANELKTTVIWNSYLDGAVYTVEDSNNVPVLKISLTKNVDKDGEYTFTVINQAASASGKVTIKSAKIATKIEIGQPEGDVIAAGDQNVYVPVIAYDAQGNQLSVEDLVSTQNLNNITISSNASTRTRLVDSGEHKGKILLDNVPTAKGSVVSINAFISTTNVHSNAQKQFTVQAARVPDYIKEVTAPAKQIVPGASTGFKYAVYDQYNKVLNTLNQVDSQGNVVTSGGNTYSVTVTAETYAPVYTNGAVTGYTLVPVTKGTSTLGSHYALVTGDADPVATNAAVFNEVATTITNLKTDLNEKTYRFASLGQAAKDYKVVLTVRILKNGQEVNKLTRQVVVVQPTVSSEMTYTLNPIATLWNARDVDNTSVTANVYDNGGTINGSSDSAGYISKETQLNPLTSKFAREVTVAAKNAAGETVAIVKNIKQISVADTNIAYAATNGQGKAYIIGNKPGTTKVYVSFQAPDGTIKNISTDVTVKGDALQVSKVTWDAIGYDDDLSFNAFTNLNVTDNYNVTYEDATAQKYNYLLGVTFAVTNVKGGTVTIDAYGNVTVTPDTVGGTVTFDLTAFANGKSATTSITANAATTARTAH